MLQSYQLYSGKAVNQVIVEGAFVVVILNPSEPDLPSTFEAR